MEPISALMGVADIVCVALILIAYDFNFFIIILSMIMVGKGVMSFF